MSLYEMYAVALVCAVCTFSLACLIAYKTARQLHDGHAIHRTLGWMVMVAIASACVRLSILGITIKIMSSWMGLWPAISAHLLACICVDALARRGI
jgi:cytochrome bd-type quinol oxidase subunit 2